jgi:hypothetical protein
MKTKLILICLIAFMLCSCTLYRPYSTKGFGHLGYKDTKIESDKFQVSFFANSNTNPQTVKNYLLYRCAEITLENGFDYFIITNENNISTSEVSVNVVGSGAFGSTKVAPAYNALIKCGKGTKPDNDNAFKAIEVKNNLEPTIKRPK